VKRLAAVLTASVLALGLLGLSASAALAGPKSGVDVVVHDGDTETVAPGDPPTACTFHLHFQAATAISGAFDIHEGDEAGPIVESGLFDTSSGDSRAPETGVFALATGSYTVTWDDEIVRDKSFDQQAIDVVCQETPPPTPTPTPTPTTAPTPTGSELPAESENPTPTGNELPAGSDAGVTVTPPATDVAQAPAASTTNAAAPVAIMLGLSALLVAWSMRLHAEVVRRPSRRR
jgi:hypothetical protein